MNQRSIPVRCRRHGRWDRGPARRGQVRRAPRALARRRPHPSPDRLRWPARVHGLPGCQRGRRSALRSQPVRLFGSSAVTPTYSSRQKALRAKSISPRPARGETIEHGSGVLPVGTLRTALGVAWTVSATMSAASSPRPRGIGDDGEFPVLDGGFHTCLRAPLSYDTPVDQMAS